MHSECNSETTSKQQCISPRQHLYKVKGPDWKNELRKNFMQRLHDSREKAFNRGRDNLERTQNDSVLNMIEDEINALRQSERVSADELNETIEEFERFLDEVNQQEINSIIAYEQERLEDLASAHCSDSVLCPKCQLCNLDFPDKHTLNCSRCRLRIHLSDPVPTAFELTAHFTRIFTSHALQECLETPKIDLQNNMLFLRCEGCEFDYRLL